MIILLVFNYKHFILWLQFSFSLHNNSATDTLEFYSIYMKWLLLIKADEFIKF